MVQHLICGITGTSPKQGNPPIIPFIFVSLYKITTLLQCELSTTFGAWSKNAYSLSKGYVSSSKAKILNQIQHVSLLAASYITFFFSCLCS